MAKVILGMTMSVDAFIRDRGGGVGALYPDLETLRNTEPLRESIQNTGAVVMGWNAFAMAEDPDSYAENPAGDKDIAIVGDASIAQQCIHAGLADELHIDIMPVLLCGGLRLFESLGTAQIQLERIAAVELPAGRTHLRFRFIK